jgi:CRP-like cAMP-binding protein
MATRPGKSDSSASIPHAYTGIFSLSSTDDLIGLQTTTRKLVKRRAIHDARDLGQLPIEAPSAVITDRRPSKGERGLILTSLAKLFIFNNIDEEWRMQIADSMVRMTVPTGDLVFKEGQLSARYFVVESGEIGLMIRGKTLNLLHEGEGFGELALLHGMPRAFTALATVTTVLWSLDRNTLRRFLQEIHTKVHQERIDLLRRVAFFAPLSDKLREVLVTSLVMRQFAPRSVISPESNPAQELYILISGAAVCVEDEKHSRKLGKGDCYGEASLLKTATDSAYLEAETTVKCLSISAEELERVLGDYFPRLIQHNLIHIALQASGTYQSLDHTQVGRLVSSMKRATFPQGSFVTLEHSSDIIRCLVKGQLKIGDFSQLNAPLLIETVEEHSIARVESVEAEIAEWQKHIFSLCIGKEQQIPGTSKFIWFFPKIPLFSSVDGTTLEALSSVRTR